MEKMEIEVGIVYEPFGCGPFWRSAMATSRFFGWRNGAGLCAGACEGSMGDCGDGSDVCE